LSDATAEKRPRNWDQTLAKPLIFVTGKGGVGKTTVSAALALALSESGKRVLIATSDPHERLSQLLGVQPLDHDLAQRAANLWAVNVDSAASLREYGAMILKAGLLHRAVFDNRAVQQFLAAIPGLYQWAILGKVWYHSTERMPQGKRRFDHVIFDAPATGHALQMLWVPKILTQVARSGLLMKDAERAWQMLHDPAHTALVLVTQAEEGPTAETTELAAKLKADLDLVPAWGVINALIQPLLSPAENDRLRQLDPRTVNDNDLRSALNALGHRAELEKGQQECLRELHARLPMPWIELPRLNVEVTDRAALVRLAAAFAGEG
jgi:anion-transporting  ArsA/GET3 family ATPase